MKNEDISAMFDHEEEDQQIDDLLYDFIQHIPQQEKKNVLKSLKLKFQRRLEFYPAVHLYL